MHPNSFIIMRRESGGNWRVTLQCEVGDSTRKGVSRSHMLAFSRNYGIARLATQLDKPIHS